MPENAAGSVTRWCAALKWGDAAAARALWDRYFNRMVCLARTALPARRAPCGADAEDVAISAFDSLCRAAAANRFPRLTSRDDLWRIIAVITVRKARDQIEQTNRQKRGGGRVLSEADLSCPGPVPAAGPLDELAQAEPTPEFLVVAEEQSRWLLSLLGDSTLQLIAVRKLEGYSNNEIRSELGCSLRTAANKLCIIRKTWQRAMACEDPA